MCGDGGLPSGRIIPRACACLIVLPSDSVPYRDGERWAVGKRCFGKVWELGPEEGGVQSEPPQVFWEEDLQGWSSCGGGARVFEATGDFTEAQKEEGRRRKRAKPRESAAPS